MQVKIGFNILGTDYLAKVEAKITVRSYGGQGPSFNDPGSPPEGCEWELVDIEVFEDTPGDIHRFGIETPQWLKDVIHDSDVLRDAVSEAEREFPYK